MTLSERIQRQPKHDENHAYLCAVETCPKYVGKQQKQPRWLRNPELRGKVLA